MKQYIKICLALALCLSLLCCMACGTSSSEQTTAAADTAVSGAVTEKTTAVSSTKKTTKSTKKNSTTTQKAASTSKKTSKAKAASTTKKAAKKKASTTKATAATAKTVSVTGPDGKLSVQIPDGWSYKKCAVESGALSVGDYGFLIFPDDSTEGYLEISYARDFGACGDNITEKTQTIAGKTATVGYESGNKNWSYIIYGGPSGHVIAIADNADSWMNSKSADVTTIINSVKLDTSTKSGEYPDEA